MIKHGRGASVWLGEAQGGGGGGLPAPHYGAKV